MRYKLRSMMMRPLLFLLFAGALAAAPQQASVRAFVGATVIDGMPGAPIARATIVVRDGRIVAIGPRVDVPKHAAIVDLAGRTIVPGLINAHGHVGETVGLRSGPDLYSRDNVIAQLRLYARYGVTTVLSLGGDQTASFEFRNAQNVPTLDRARLFVAGPVLTPGTPEEAVAAVGRVAALRPDFVKIRVDDNLGTTSKMPESVYRAVIDAAHRQKLRVAAHVFYQADAKALLRAGVDLIAHSVRDVDVDDELVQLLKERSVCVCPTLTREVSTFIYETRPAFFDDPFFLREADTPSGGGAPLLREVIEQLQDPKRQKAMRESSAAARYKVALETASRNLRKLVDSGVRVAFGTDSGPPARFQGYFEHMELELMAKAGLTPQQILQSATSNAARCIGVGDIGTLKAGAWADFVVLKENPAADIRKMRTIESVYVAGNQVPGVRFLQ